MTQVVRGGCWTEVLTRQQRAALAGWLAVVGCFGAIDGAWAAPKPEPGAVVRKTDAISEADRHFWSFQPVKKPAVPSAGDRGSPGTPVDAFIVARLAEKGLKAGPDAGRRVLIRRLYYDLIGLPPTPEEVEDFVADADPNAYERLVDRLLASPHYGERWGRHWLDVAGFAESSLFIGDVVRPGFWRYRDYVIRAFNNDKPYDRFLIEQLAGDELVDWRNAEEFTPDMVEKLVATGFLRCPPDATDNQPITQMDKRYATQQAAMEVSMKALMGLTIQCVRCHSHKYDPIPQEDYYKLIAVFQPAYDPDHWIPGIFDANLALGPVRAIPILDRKGREEQKQRMARLHVERTELRGEERSGVFNRWRNRYVLDHTAKITDPAARERAEALREKPSQQCSEADEAFLGEQGERLGVTANLLRDVYPDYTKELQRVKTRIKKLTDENAKLPPVIWGLWDASIQPSPTRLLRRGDFESPAQEIAPGALSVLDTPGNPFCLPPAPPHGATTGRRLALAQWLTNPAHPLTARVMVNRIWQYHFGNGLVATPDDFGARGARPTHPELLDWLAAEFVEHGWSIKHVHRLILLSSTYRQSSRDEPAARRADPMNQLLWQFPKRRLEAEAIRDALLEVSGQLDKRQFGDSARAVQQSDGQYAVPADAPDRNRRSVYLSTKRTQVPTFLAVFDAPAMDTNWPKRSAAAIAQQALALMNNPFMHECVDHFTRRVLAGGDTTPRRLDYALKLAYGRPPTTDELELFEGFLKQQGGDEVGGDETGAWRLLSHALLSANEFIYVD